MAEPTPLRVERDGAILRLTVDRPERHNPLSMAVLTALREALLKHAHDPALRCVIITGAGERYFAAGGDVLELEAVRSEDDARLMSDRGRTVLDTVRDCPVPVVAVLNGDAIGGGSELAVACDFRLMREGTHIGFIHGKLAITSAWGGGPDLASLVGPARALRMMSRCELVPAQTALAWGLADLVVPDAAAMPTAVDEFIAPILRQTRAALTGAVEQTRALRRGEPYRERREIEQRHFVQAWVHEDHWAAVERFKARKRGA